MYFHNGHTTRVCVEGDVPVDLIQGWGNTPAEAAEDFWRNVRLEAGIARERDADPDAPLTQRMILALKFEGEDPTDHTA